MGRTKRQFPKGRCRLHTPRVVEKNKAYPVQYEYTWNGNTIRRDSGIKVRLADWNDKGASGRGELRSSYGSNYVAFNNRLSDFLDNTDAEMMLYHQQHPGKITTDVVHSILFGEPLTRKDEGKDFCEYVLATMKERLITNHIGRSRFENEVSCMKVFSEFLISQKRGTYKDDGIYLGEISREIIVAYIDYRRSIKKNKDATINHSLTPIIIACEKAKDSGYIDSKTYSEIKSCRLVVVPSLEEERYDGKHLSKQELGKLIEFYNNDTEPRRKEYIEMFLFAFHAGGLRLVDVMTLCWKHVNFEKRELRKILVKTATSGKPRHTIPLNDSAICILRKWESLGRRHRLVFDLLPDDFDLDNSEMLYYSRNSVDKKINQSLHVVGEKIGLSFTLNFHCARHTFAILSMNDGMNLSVVSRLLGHSTTNITERVYAAYLPETLSEEMEKLHYSFLPQI